MAATSEVPLVNADDEWAGYLEDAQRLIDEKSYDLAIDILQALIRREDSGFVALPGGQRYASLWTKANELVGRLGPAGLKLYRRLYDPQAQRVYEKGIQNGDAGLLRQVACQYLHTSFGPKALDAVGDIYFDRGRFLQAARCWRQAVQLCGDDADRALLTGKVAVAHHLAGDSPAAEKALERVKRRHANAEACLAGQKQRIVDFIARVRSMSAAITPERESPTGWPGIGGFAGGMAIMGQCHAVPMPRWSQPSFPSGRGRLRPKALMAMSGEFGGFQGRGPHSLHMRIKGGHLQVRAYSGNRRKEFYCPAAIHPVTAGEKVICRTDQAVIAYDMITGQEIWRSEGFPVERNLSGVGRPESRYRGAMKVGDRGRHVLTIGEGKVFAVGNFRPLMSPGRPWVGRRIPAEGSEMAAELADTSTLAAFSVGKGTGGGNLLWRIGYGMTSDDEATEYKFMSPPAYHAGRIYALAGRLQSYYLLCANAATGSLLWKALVSQTPPITRRYGGYNDYLAERCSIPTVADGMVLALTNAGVVAAFDADTGRAVWAFQYAGAVDQTPARGLPAPRGSAMFEPANPVIVTGGRVVCLPADSEKVIALSVEDGSPVWPPLDRQGQAHLSAVDSDRVLLSGPGLIVISAINGEVVSHARVDTRILGRPAVTQTAVLASGPGRVYRLDLDSYELTSTGLADASGLLGNLVSANGNLFAANAAGLSAYFSFEHAHRRLTERMTDASETQRAQLLCQRAQLAFHARRFDQALEDLLECISLAGGQGKSQAALDLPAKARSWLYRTYVALGNRAEKPQEMLAMFRKAQNQAATLQEKAHMMVRLAKYHEGIGQYAAAAAIAQEVDERYADEELVDVPIGAEADDTVRFDAGRQSVRGKKLAREFIRRLIEIHGRELYAEFDSKAAAALATAVSNEDPDAMLAVAERWSNSASADDALFAAAETYYERAVEITRKAELLRRPESLPEAAEPPVEEAKRLAGEANVLLGRAVEHLSAAVNTPDPDGSGRRLDAAVALAIVHARRGHAVMAGLTSSRIREWSRKLPACSLDRSVSFADIEDTAGHILQSVESGKVPASASATEFISAIRLPLRKVFSLKDRSVQVLRDHEFRPVRLGQNVFLLRDKNIVLLDTSADNAEDAVQWAGLTSVDTGQQERYRSMAPGSRLLGGLSRDGKVLIVADRNSMTGLAVRTGRMLWQKKMSDIGIAQFGSAAVADGTFVAAARQGQMTCLDIASGTENCRAKLKRKSYLPYSPQIKFGVVLATDSSFRRLWCIDAANGKLLESWSAKKFLQGYLTDEGLLVTMRDGELSAYQIEAIRQLNSRPLWQRTYAAEKGPAILAVGNDAIVVSPEDGADYVEVLWISGGGRAAAKLSTADVRGKRPAPVEAWIDGKNVYIASSLGAGARKRLYGRFSMCNGLSIQKFDLMRQSKPLVWSRDLDLDPRHRLVVLPPTVTREHIVVMARPLSANQPFKAYVLGAAGGNVLEEIDLVGEAEDREVLTIRWQLIGQPVVTNGRLLVETCEGVTVYGGR